ncbi:unnamed protein product [Blepharisma stoltei]|uniref:BACK domain-containing protein n=1 Tax=Blepharisma stoltei TaxID=1481888 RepID=A0AAU9KD64_9CILI|nr:unnamed protein product [Blepharisma stoltei]
MEFPIESKNQDLFLIIEGEKFEIDSWILRDINAKLPTILPASITKTHFSQFCAFLSSPKTKIKDQESLCKIFEIAAILQHPLSEKISQNMIIPRLNKNSSLIFFDAAVNQIKTQNNDLWNDIYEACLVTIDDYIFAYTKNDFLCLSIDSIQALLNIYYNQQVASTIILALKLKREALGIFDLLNKEELINSKSFFLPDIDYNWVLPKDKTTIYFESEAFLIENLKFSLILIKFPNENKCELYLQSSRNAEEQRIITLSYTLKIAEKKYKNVETINMISGPNSQFLILSFAIDLISQHLETRINFCLKLEKIMSAILNYIAENPDESLLIEDLSTFSRARLSLLLKFKHLKIANEDDALNLVGRFAQENNISHDALSDLLGPIKWEFVSSRALFRSAFTYKALGESPYFIQKFNQELFFKTNCQKRKHQERPRLSCLDLKNEGKNVLDDFCNCFLDDEEPPKETEAVYLNEILCRKDLELQNLKGSFNSLSLTRCTSTPDIMQTKPHDEMLDISPEFPPMSPIKKFRRSESPLNPIPELILPDKAETTDFAILSLLSKLEKY